jgi:dipeptidyl aminopeptidase/acylaminoacyl peptidase
MRPKNEKNTAPAASLPSLIIAIHSGLTSCFRPSVHRESKYYSTRGYVVMLLNHAGSIGYGRAYQEQLSGQ